jgi:hypothetical protein
MTSKTVQQVFCGIAEAAPVLLHDCQESIALGVNMGFPFTLFVSDPSFSSSTRSRSSLDTKLFVTSDSCSEANNHIDLRDIEISTKSRSRQNKIPRFVINFIASETRKTFPHQHKWVVPEFSPKATISTGATHRMVSKYVKFRFRGGTDTPRV